MVTAAPGATSTYGLTVGIKLDVEPVIGMISPTDVPFQGSAMGATDAIGLPTGTVFEKKYEWLDETILTPRSTIAATSTTGDAFVTLASGDGLKFQTGDMLLIGSEYVRVTGYSFTTSDILLVTRAVSGSAATVATSADVIGVGSILPEGSDPPLARYQDRNNRYNYTEIFGPVAVQSTNSRPRDPEVRDHQRVRPPARQPHQGAGDRGRAGDRLRRAHRRHVEQVAVDGGHLAHITSVVDSTTTQLTLASLNTMLATIYANGGTPDVIVARRHAEVGDLDVHVVGHGAGATCGPHRGQDHRRRRKRLRDPARAAQPLVPQGGPRGVQPGPGRDRHACGRCSTSRSRSRVTREGHGRGREGLQGVPPGARREVHRSDLIAAAMSVSATAPLRGEVGGAVAGHERSP
jgi:hypothetical protein